MKDVEYLSKDDNIAFGKTRYKAISEEKVTSTVRESLLKNGLIILPVEQEHFRVETLSTVNTKYKIVDIDTGQHEILVSSGTGVDTQDKGVGKAMTYAYKYMLLRTFAIPTGEDPDKVSSAELDHKQQKSTPSKAGISQSKIKTLEALLQQLDNPEGYRKQILSYNKVDKLEDLTDYQYGKALESINRKLNE